VLRAQDDDGDGGSGTGGATGGTISASGGAAPEAHLVELSLQTAHNPAAEDVAVMVNDDSGALRASFVGTDLPVKLEITEGSLVSYLYRDSAQQVLSSFRVTPEVTRVHVVTGFPDAVPCDGEPMHVNVDMPSVGGPSTTGSPPTTTVTRPRCIPAR